MRPILGHVRDSTTRRLLLGLGFTLIPLPAAAGTLTPAVLDPFIATLVSSGAVALALGAGLWAFVQHKAAERLRRQVRVSIARARAAVGERDALLAAGKEAL